MMYPYVKYANGTEVVFSHIMQNENNEEIDVFKTVVERGLPSFYRWARQGGIQIA